MVSQLWPGICFRCVATLPVSTTPCIVCSFSTFPTFSRVPTRVTKSNGPSWSVFNVTLSSSRSTCLLLRGSQNFHASQVCLNSDWKPRVFTALCRTVQHVGYLHFGLVLGRYWKVWRDPTCFPAVPSGTPQRRSPTACSHVGNHQRWRLHPHPGLNTGRLGCGQS
jgi:hypothetical protein